MTTNEIVEKIEALSSEYAVASAAIPLLGKPAVSKAAELDKALAEAKAQLVTMLAEEADAARKARLSTFSDINVSYPDEPERSVLTLPFTIRYTRLTYDMAARASIPQEHSCNGFSALPDEAYEYLMTVHPEKVPAPIAKLFPDNVHEAMAIYLQARDRGYFKGGR